MKLLGQDVIFSLAGETVAFATSCEIETDTDFIEVCSPVSGADKEYLPTTFGWSLSGNYLCANLADKARLIELQRANTKFEVRIFDRKLSTVLRGYCYIKNLRLSASVGSLAKFAATYQPTGGLVPVEAVAPVWSAERNIPFLQITWPEESHKFVNIHSGSLPVRELKLLSMAKLMVAETEDDTMSPLLLCKAKDMDAMVASIQNTFEKGMLSFYAENEVGHYFPMQPESEEYVPTRFADRVLKPGTYYLVGDTSCATILESLPATT